MLGKIDLYSQEMTAQSSYAFNLDLTTKLQEFERCHSKVKFKYHCHEVVL